MKQPRMLSGALAAGALSATQAFSATVTIEPPTELIVGMINRFAEFTITESQADEFEDGYFHLYVMTNAELDEYYFDSRSHASGSVGPEGAVPRGTGLLVQVDADDSRIDAITVRSYGYFLISMADSGNNITVSVQDGEEGLHEVTGDLSGVTLSQRLRLGAGGTKHYRNLAPAGLPEVREGETISVELDDDEYIHPPYTVNVLTSSNVNASISGNVLSVTGISAGEAELEVMARAHLHREKYWFSPFSFEVLAALTGDSDEEDEGPSPGDDDTPPNTDEDGTPPPDGSDETPDDTDTGGSPPDNTDETPLGTDNEDNTLVDDDVDTVSLEPTLPVLEGRMMGEGTTTAVIAAGATAGGVEFDTEFTTDDIITVQGEILPDAAHMGEPGEIFVVVKVVLESGLIVWFYQDNDGRFVRWDGSLASLQPALEVEAMEGIHTLEVFEGSLIPAVYELLFGYMVDEDFVYSMEPLEIRVRE